MKVKSRSKYEFDKQQIIDSEQHFIDCYTSGKTTPIAMLFKFFKGYYTKLLISSVFFVIKASPTWALPIITSNVINIVINRPEDYVKKIIFYFILSIVLIVQNVPFHMFHAMFYSEAARNVEAGLRGAMIRKLQQLTISFHKETPSGKIQSKVMRDVDSIMTFSSQMFQTSLNVGINMTISLIVIITKNILVFLMFVLCIPLVVIMKEKFFGKIKKSSHKLRKNIEATASAVYDMEELVPITRAHALEKKEIKKLTNSITEVANSGYKFDYIQNLFGSANWVIFLVFQFICLFFTVFLALNNKITVGEIALYQSYFGALTGFVTSIMNIMPQIATGSEAINSIGEILKSGDIENNSKKKKISDLEGNYQFENVFFKYDDEEENVLKGLNIDVHKGETIALVGESGCGKSTIINLVTGFNKPQSGSILVDGIDMNEINLHSYRKFISIVPQQSILFSGTIRDNITYGCSDISDEFLDYVVKSAKLDSLINKLPDGLDTYVGEQGAKLSGGQSQRISIARAIIRNPKVIIFDEATSALDSITEREIQEAIDNLTTDRTTFIVAHRLSTIRNADKIAVINNGKCIEFGTFEELMALKGEFYTLKSNQ